MDKQSVEITHFKRKTKLSATAICPMQTIGFFLLIAYIDGLIQKDGHIKRVNWKKITQKIIRIGWKKEENVKINI